MHVMWCHDSIYSPLLMRLGGIRCVMMHCGSACGNASPPNPNPNVRVAFAVSSISSYASCEWGRCTHSYGHDASPLTLALALAQALALALAQARTLALAQAHACCRCHW